MPGQVLRFGARADRVAAAVEALVPSAQIPGAVFGLECDGERRFSAIGFMDIERSRPMPMDAIFRIASLTKPVAAVAALQMVEDGLFTLDDPVSRLAPELAAPRVLRRIDGPVDDTVAAERPILMGDLLACRIGLGMLLPSPEAPRPPILDLMAERGFAVTPNAPPFADADAYLAALADMPLMRHPGETWLYDTSINVLGAVMERAAGKPLPHILAERVFEPLGMVDTGFHVAQDALDRLPPSYRAGPSADAPRAADKAGAESRYAAPPAFASAAAGLVTTAEDYLAFCRAMRGIGAKVRSAVASGAALSTERGGAPLSPASYAAMTTGQIAPEQRLGMAFGPGFWERHNWGLGVALLEGRAPGDAFGVGWDGGRGTTASWDVETGVSAALFTQRMLDGAPMAELFHAFRAALHSDRW
ncbi:MAG: serine hydrolase domain-containing protein [Pseudomonadota bacterium]